MYIEKRKLPIILSVFVFGAVPIFWSSVQNADVLSYASLKFQVLAEETHWDYNARKLSKARLGIFILFSDSEFKLSP